MTSGKDGADAAFKLLQDWQWLRCDPDGVPFQSGKPLSVVVNRLAMEGLTSPQDAVLNLLCDGRLLSRGDYHWQKYQFGKYYHLEGGSEQLKPFRWQILLDMIDEERQRLANNEWAAPTVDLDKLGRKDCPVYDWDFNECYFQTALRPPDTVIFDPTYLEEWFSAREIEVWPSDLHYEDLDDEPQPEVANESRGGRPAAKWWPDFAEELAVHIHENGIPEGQGHDGQSAMIDAIFARMAGAGKGEPGRGTVQPVVNAVLRRIRSAGN